jgi:hypothetical protein
MCDSQLACSVVKISGPTVKGIVSSDFHSLPRCDQLDRMAEGGGQGSGVGALCNDRDAAPVCTRSCGVPELFQVCEHPADRSPNFLKGRSARSNIARGGRAAADPPRNTPYPRALSACAAFTGCKDDCAGALLPLTRHRCCSPLTCTARGPFLT